MYFGQCINPYSWKQSTLETHVFKSHISEPCFAQTKLNVAKLSDLGAQRIHVCEVQSSWQPTNQVYYNEEAKCNGLRVCVTPHGHWGSGHTFLSPSSEPLPSLHLECHLSSVSSDLTFVSFSLLIIPRLLEAFPNYKYVSSYVTSHFHFADFPACGFLFKIISDCFAYKGYTRPILLLTLYVHHYVCAGNFMGWKSIPGQISSFSLSKGECIMGRTWDLGPNHPGSTSSLLRLQISASEIICPPVSNRPLFCSLKVLGILLQSTYHWCAFIFTCMVIWIMSVFPTEIFCTIKAKTTVVLFQSILCHTLWHIVSIK